MFLRLWSGWVSGLHSLRQRFMHLDGNTDLVSNKESR